MPVVLAFSSAYGLLHIRLRFRPAPGIANFETILRMCACIRTLIGKCYKRPNMLCTVKVLPQVQERKLRDIQI